MSNRWEKQVKVSLKDIFDTKEETPTDEKEVSIEKKTEIENLFGSKKEIVFDMKGEDEEEEVNTYGFSHDDLIELIAKEIDLKIAKEYVDKTDMNPVDNDHITDEFYEWWAKKQEKKIYLTPKDIDKKIKEYKLETQTITNTSDATVTPKLIEERSDDLDTYKNALSWLFKFMDNFKVDFVPSDEDMKNVNKINELINNE